LKPNCDSSSSDFTSIGLLQSLKDEKRKKIKATIERDLEEAKKEEEEDKEEKESTGCLEQPKESQVGGCNAEDDDSVDNFEPLHQEEQLSPYSPPSPLIVSKPPRQARHVATPAVEEESGEFDLNKFKYTSPAVTMSLAANTTTTTAATSATTTQTKTIKRPTTTTKYAPHPEVAPSTTIDLTSSPAKSKVSWARSKGWSEATAAYRHHYNFQPFPRSLRSHHVLLSSLELL